MKLFQIWNAVKAWQTVSGLKKSPDLAYKLFKYGKLAAVELEFCQQRSRELVSEVLGTDPAESVSITSGSPEFDAWYSKFNEALQKESDLPAIDITLDNLIEDLKKFPGNSISEDEIELLEPFFTQPQV